MSVPNRGIEVDLGSAADIILGVIDRVAGCGRDCPPGVPEFELYDRSVDPLDRHDVAAQHAEVVERLARELAAWRNVAKQPKLKSDADTAAALSPEELERLRALGYVQLVVAAVL